MQHTVSNNAVAMKKNSLKRLWTKSLKIISTGFGVSLLSIGGYVLGLMYLQFSLCLNKNF